MEFRTLRQAEREAWFDHCAEVFEKTGRAYFVRHYEKDPSTRDEDIFVAMDGETIAATVRVFKRRIYIKGQAVGMGGIGEVSTKERYRRQGLSGELLKMAIAHMENLELPVSTLYTGTNHHYERYGWQTHNTRSVLMNTPTAALPQGYAIREATQEDWDCFPALYDLYMPGLNGAVVREDMGYWDGWVRAETAKAYAVIRQEDGAVPAYMFTRAAKEAGKPYEMQEFAAEPESKDLLLPVLGELAREAGAESVSLPGPYCFGMGEESESSGLMARLNLPFSLAGERIETTQALRAAFENPLPITIDSF